MSDAMYRISEFFDSSFGTVIKAILILILAFIVAAIAKSLIIKLLSKTRLADSRYSVTTSGNEKQSVVELLGKLVQLIVFLLFVPGIFEILGINQVSTPIVGMLQKLIGYIPNILGCGVILWIGFYAARLVRELLIPVFNKIQINKLQTMAGIQVSDTGKLSSTLAYIVYVLILIPVIIAALYVLDIKAITDPLVAMLSVVFSYIPNILAALIIITIGWILAKFIGNIVTRLIAASGLDAKIADMMDVHGENFVLSNVAGKTVEVILVIFFIVESLSTLHLGVLTKVGVAIIAYMPYLLTAFIILVICMFISGTVSKALTRNGHEGAAVFCRYLIYVVGAFMILNELGIARTLVDSTFILAVAALAVAFAISFGIGGRDFARHVLAALEARTGLNRVDPDAAAVAADKALKDAAEDEINQ